MSLIEKRDAFIAAKIALDEAEGARKEAKALFTKAELALKKAMRDNKTPRLPYGDDILIYTSDRFSCSVTQENDGKIRDWLLDTVGDDMPYVEEKVAKGPLTEFLKTLKPHEIPDFLNAGEWTAVNVLGWRKSKKT